MNDFFRGGLGSCDRVVNHLHSTRATSLLHKHTQSARICRKTAKEAKLKEARIRSQAVARIADRTAIQNHDGGNNKC